MKSTRILVAICGAAALVLAAVALPTAAQAGGHVSWSVGISTGVPVYRAPPPVYVQQPPVYVQRQPIYVQPQPVYVQPRPIYVQPQPIYAPPPYYGGPVVGVPSPAFIEPRAVYPIGWAPRGHWRHRHGRGPGWRY